MKHRLILSILLPILGLSMAASAAAMSFFSAEAEPTLAWSGTQTSTEGNYYSSCKGLSGSALVSKLKSIISNANVSYDWSRYMAADEAEGDSSSILTIYSREVVDKDWRVGGSSEQIWNREHTYPQSKISGDATSDNHLIFASDKDVNNARGNHKLGEVSNHSSPVYDAFDEPTDCYLVGDVFEPCDAAKGEVARATMYAAVKYGLSIEGNITSTDLCLNWNDQFPVTNREIYRNNTVYTLQKNRNPFIDHPEFARMCFDPNYDGPGALMGDSAIVEPESITLSDTSLTMEVGDTYSLSAVVSPSNANDLTVTFSSSAPAIVFATIFGDLTAQKEGTATITASTYNGITATCEVRVVGDAITATVFGLDVSGSGFDVTDGGLVIHPQGFIAFATKDRYAKIEGEGELIISSSADYSLNDGVFDFGEAEVTISNASDEDITITGISFFPSSPAGGGTSGCFNAIVPGVSIGTAFVLACLILLLIRKKRQRA